ncbi:hypothetical protein A2U01_0091953, partial [Trifolium medium]|nr:hypothetical protein [Trifolium medium]
ARREADHALVRGPKLLLDAKIFTTGVLLWNGFNTRARNATALIPARTWPPRQKRGRLSNKQSSVIGLHKD